MFAELSNKALITPNIFWKIHIVKHDPDDPLRIVLLTTSLFFRGYSKGKHKEFSYPWPDPNQVGNEAEAMGSLEVKKQKKTLYNAWYCSQTH